MRRGPGRWALAGRRMAAEPRGQWTGVRRVEPARRPPPRPAGGGGASGGAGAARAPRAGLVLPGPPGVGVGPGPRRRGVGDRRLRGTGPGRRRRAGRAGGRVHAGDAGTGRRATFDPIASISAVHAADDHEAWLARMSDPAVSIVTTTVTEAGYRLAADGRLDLDDPAVTADVDVLRSDPVGPATTAPGRLLAGLVARARAGRRAAGARPLRQPRRQRPGAGRCPGRAGRGRRPGARRPARRRGLRW